MQGGTSPKAQPFSEHVRELRRRAIYSIATLFLGSIAGFVIRQPLFSLIRRPLHQQLYYTTPTGGFNAIIKVSLVFGVIVTVPVLVYQLGKFLSPAFNRRIHIIPIIFFSITLAALGVLFAYFVSLPAALHFLANIDSKNLQSLITVNEYLNFVFSYVAGFALLFQLPLVMLFINRIKPQRPGRLMRIQRWVILVSFIVAAILTPTPDPFNQFIMAAPIILLYQFSVVLVWFVNRKNVAPAAAIIQLEPVAEPQTIPAPVMNSAPDIPQVAKSRQPQLIMDVFWIPHNPGA
jgi:sec-independent protein translocase protein TatC